MNTNQRQGAPEASRVDAALTSALEQKRIIGAVLRVARHGEVVIDRAAGLADREAGVAMRGDMTFRYSSLTKPIVVAAALALVDRGALSLDADITRWLPDFRPTFEGAALPITVAHLLTHTSGLSYGFFEPAGVGPYHAANVSDGMDQPGLSLDENLRRLGRAPLAFPPGRAFLYSLATDVLGGVIARAAGVSLPELVARAVTGPLGMRDTSFVARDGVPLVTPYSPGAPQPTRMEDGAYVPFGEGGVTFTPSRARDPRSYASGGTGLVGTAGDFLRFLEAVRTRDRFVSGRWLDAMTCDRIAPLSSPILGDGWGFGFGGAVLRDPVAAKSPLGAGTLRWGGVYGHSWWIDPGAGISAVLLTNTAFEGMAGVLRDDVERAVCGA